MLPKANLLPGTLDPLIRISSERGPTETGRRAKFYTLMTVGSKQPTVEGVIWDRLDLAIPKVRKAI